MEAKQDNGNNGKKPINKKFLICLGVIFAVIIVAIIIISSVDKCNGNKVNDEIYYINDKVNSKSLQYEVIGVSNHSSVGILGGAYYYTTANNFLAVDLSITNTSSQNVKFNLSFVSLHKDKNSYQYHASTYFINGGSFAKEISIGASLSNIITIVFETPTPHTHEDYYLYVKGSESTPNEQILLRTRTGGYGEPFYEDGGYY